MAEKIFHVKMYDGIYRVVTPGYGTGIGLGDGTLVGLSKPMIDVVVGEKLAAVIDTGNGDVDLKKYIEENITDKPLICLNTHGHIDHIGANNQFGEVWLNWRDIDCAKAFLRHATDRLHEAVLACPEAKYNPIYGGEIFDLGGRTLRAVPIPGHSLGSTGFIDSKCNILFAGDAVLKRMGATGVSAPFLRKILTNLKKEHFDEILSGHWLWPLGRDQIDRFIYLIDTYSPEKLTPIVNDLGGRKQHGYMYYIGKDFYDPDFCALTLMNPEKFFGEEFELGDKTTEVPQFLK